MSREGSKTIAAGVFLVVVTVYALLPTRNYYWDGIAFAQTIENATAATWPALIHPNHLTYDLFGYAFYAAAGHFGIRALTVLQYLNIGLSGAAAGLLYLIVRNLTRSNFLGISGALLFAFSAAWWKFSTDADSYIASVLCLLVVTYLTLCAEKVRPLAIAGVHVLAISLHQLAALMFPAVIAGLLMRSSKAARLKISACYSILASVVSVVAYYAGFAAQTHQFAIHPFIRWISSHASDAAFTFTIASNILISLRSQVKLFVDGRLSFLQATHPVVVVLAVLWLSSFIVFARVSIKQRARIAEFVRAIPQCGARPEIIFATVWVLSYAVFLLFWLPHNTFYRLFYLPALIIIMATVWRCCFQNEQAGRSVLASFVFCLALFNLAFFIYPYAQVWANPPLKLALEANAVWPAGTTVVFGQFTTDNWTFRYFNPQTTWLAWSEVDASQLRDSGMAVWFDGTAAKQLRTWPLCKNVARPELRNDRYGIRFVQALPCTSATP